MWPGRSINFIRVSISTKIEGAGKIKRRGRVLKKRDHVISTKKVLDFN